MRQFKVYLFGPPRIELEGHRLDIGLNKAVALFTYIAVTRQPHSRDTLATFFWPKSNQDMALGSLRRALHRLNRILGPDLLRITRRTVEVNHSLDLWLDIEQFQQLVSECFSTPALSDPSPKGASPEEAACLAWLEEAAELYTSDFLSGFSLPDSPDFDEWQFFQAEHLRRSFGSVLARLTQAYMAQSNWEKALGYARRWTALDPLDELPHRRLMELYAWSGQYAAAMRQYNECQRILKEELGSRPEAETTALWEAIKTRQLPAPGQVEPRLLDASAPATAVLPPPASGRRLFTPGHPHNLTTQPYPFVGRRKELAEIRRWLVDNQDYRLISIVGPGGIGKTRLALEAAYATAQAFPNGVYFIPLASLPSAAHLIPTLAEHLGLHPLDSGALWENLLGFLRKKCILLVLDNFDHLLSSANLIAEILQVAPEVKILVTSGERLSLSGELVYVLGSMSYPENEAQDSDDEFGAVQLLIQCARLARPQIEIRLQDFPQLARICRLVQGMPLAIVLAAGWLEVLSFEEVADEIEQSLDFLEARMSDIPERHSSVRAAFEYSWNRLSLHDQQAFMCLSIFRGGFTRHAAHVVAGATLHSLRNLIQKSLVSIRRDGRYEVHELLRKYAVEQLATSGEEGHLRWKHCEYYLGLISQLEPELKAGQQFKALDTIEADFENIRAAWNWALQQLENSTADRELRHALSIAICSAAESLYLYFAFRSRYPEGAELFRQARDRLSQLFQAGNQPACERVRARYTWLQILNFAQDERIELDIRTCLSQAQALGDRSDEAFCWMALGMHTYLAKQDPIDALPYYERAHDLFRDLNDPFYTACTLYYLGECHGEVTDLSTMIQFTRQSLELCRQTGNNAILTFNLHNLARAAFYAGDFSASEAYCQEALDLDVKMGLKLGIADSKTLLSVLYILRGDLEKASLLANECLEIGREISFVNAISEALGILSLLSAIQGDEAAGKELAEESLRMISSALGRTVARWGMVVACMGLGETDLAWEHLHAALGEASRLAFPGLLYLLSPLIALCHLSRARAVQAAETLSLSSHLHPDLTGWWSDWPPLESLRDQLQAGLGQPVFQSAWKRGQKLDVSALASELLPEVNDETDEVRV